MWSSLGVSFLKLLSKRMMFLLLLCLASSAMANSQKQVHSPPKITEPNEETVKYFTSGSSFVIPCKANSKPNAPRYKWLKGTTPIVPDQFVKFDEVSGDLTFTNFSERDHGVYICVASTLFNSRGRTFTATSFSPTVYLRHIPKLPLADYTVKTAEEYSYVKLECANKGEIVGDDDISFIWFKGIGTTVMDLDSRHLYVDHDGRVVAKVLEFTIGHLHFSYVKKTDETNGHNYQCCIMIVSERLMRCGSVIVLEVRAITNQTAVKPRLKYMNSGVEAFLNSTVTLECVFSGYDPKAPHFPTITWTMLGGEVIINDSKYTLSSYGRALTIRSVTASDEKNYYCSASNSAGVVGPQAVFLKVTLLSSPKITEPQAVTVKYFTSGSSFVIPCKANSKLSAPRYTWVKGTTPIVPDQFVKFDEVSGDMTFTNFSERDQGVYICVASTVFNSRGGKVTATSFSPTVTLYQTCVLPFTDNTVTSKLVEEYSYVRLDCAKKGKTVGNDISINWYKDINGKQLDLDSGRLYVDHNGNIHFSFVKKADETSSFSYVCGISSVSERLTRFGSITLLDVRAITDQVAVKPRLQYTNSGVEAMLKSTVTLECVFSGYDPKAPHFPTIKWTMPGGEVIINDSKYTLSSDGRALTIRSVTESDEKNYYCSASNSAGVVGPRAVFLKVTLLSSPKITEPQAVTVKYFTSGSSFVIPCKANSKPNAPRYTWLKGTTPIVPDQFVKFDEVSGDMTFTSFSERNQGVYICVASTVFNSRGGTFTATSFSPTVTLYQTRVLPFTDHDQTVSSKLVEEYSYLRLDCAKNGKTVGYDISINWYNGINGKLDLDSGRLYVDHNGNLHFSYVKKTDETICYNYYCGFTIVSENLTHFGSITSLQVRAITNQVAVKPRLQYTNSGVEAFLNSTVTLECVFSGYDPKAPHFPTIKWTMSDDKVIINDSKYTLSSDGQALTIRSVTESDEKNYYCSASNNAGVAGPQAVFLNVTLLSSPKITEPQAVTVKYFTSGSSFVIPCKANSKPNAPRYKWLKERTPIVPDQFVKFDELSGDLTFATFSERDQGVYICLASTVFNSWGLTFTATSFSPSVTLYHTSVLTFTDNTVTSKLVEEYSYVRFDCANKSAIVGDDISINWYKDKDMAVYLDSGRLYVDHYGNLHFSYAKRTDESTSFVYLCGILIVSEKVIRFGSRTSLHVRTISNQAAVTPRLQYTNSGVKALLNSTVTLECVFSGYDPKAPHFPTIKWTMQGGKEIIDDSKYTVSSEGRALNIKSVTASDEKNYYCSASNSAGVVGPRAVFLNVTSAPVFNVEPRDQTVREGKEVAFSCDARSLTNERPPSSPTWYINGILAGKHTDGRKYIIEEKKLTVKSISKGIFALCVQCSVTNSVGTTWGNGCLNVI